MVASVRRGWGLSCAVHSQFQLGPECSREDFLGTNSNLTSPWASGGGRGIGNEVEHRKVGGKVVL